jgi:hypothetical protein
MVAALRMGPRPDVIGLQLIAFGLSLNTSTFKVPPSFTNLEAPHGGLALRSRAPFTSCLMNQDASVSERAVKLLLVQRSFSLSNARQNLKGREPTDEFDAGSPGTTGPRTSFPSVRSRFLGRLTGLHRFFCQSLCRWRSARERRVAVRPSRVISLVAPFDTTSKPTTPSASASLNADWARFQNGLSLSSKLWECWSICDKACRTYHRSSGSRVL